MYNIYVYAIDTMADWEMGLLLAELNSRRFFRRDAPEIALHFAGTSMEAVKTMGGLTMIPDCLIRDILVDETSVLILPGASTWQAPRHTAVLDRAAALLDAGGTVCAICGATAALADRGLLDARPHTSNGAGFLDAFCPSYKGQPFFVDAPSVSDGSLITAGATGALMWTKQILERLDVFCSDMLRAWYDYFSTGEAQSFFALMQSLPSAR